MGKQDVIERKKKKVWKRVCVIVVAVIVLLHLIALIAVPTVYMSDIVGRRYDQTQYSAADYGLDAEQLTLHTDDDLAIAAWRTRATDTKGTVIILSGIQSPSVTAFFGYARMLADAGWDSLLIEMRARSESGGDEIGLGMTEWLDVKAGVTFLEGEADIGQLPIVAMGTSMGASTVIIAAGEVPGIDGVISISAFSSWTDTFADTMATMEIPSYFCVLERPFVSLYLGIHYGFDQLKYSAVDEIANLGDRPILLMHSKEDSQVPYTSYERLLNKAQESGVPVTSFVREGNEHMICYDAFFDTPEKDSEFSAAVFQFLSENFEAPAA